MVTAFIPVRGGSKSIPLKNIKSFCGKPLVCWNIEALERVSCIDEIIVATDSDEIANVVAAQKYTKTRIYRRSAENASDSASTESVILEYLNYSQLPPTQTFMLVQATSPLTQSQHFEEALAIYSKGYYNSMLSCVRNYRFFWNEDGTSKNYDYTHRPRRQEFKGELMENGAFYINTVENIIKTKNRLSGKIGIYEMPEFTATEIDEPDDWTILERLMYKHVLCKQKQSKIKLFISDVDGTLTDGGMYYSENGEELKKFNTRDGMGFQILKENGIKTAIITSENTKIVSNRAKKLKIDYLIQGSKYHGKLQSALDICHKESIKLSEIAYIGDDVNCIPLLEAAGIAACPNDAVNEVKNIPGIIILQSKGGEGAVREFCTKIINQ